MKTIAPTTLSEHVDCGALTETTAQAIRDAIRGAKPIVVAGPTGSGKTTLLQSVVRVSEDIGRVAVIEDTKELQTRHQHSSYLRTDFHIGAKHLLNHAVRLAHQDLFLGEMREPDATLQLTEFWMGGCAGAATLQAQSLDEAVSRWAHLCALGATPVVAHHPAVYRAFDPSLTVEEAVRIADGPPWLRDPEQFVRHTEALVILLGRERSEVESRTLAA